MIIAKVVNPYFLVIKPIVSIGYGMCLGAFTALRKTFQQLCAIKFYNTAQQIQEIKSISEKEAFICGTDSNNWKGYFSSFVNYQAYKHPIAFSAGMAQGAKILDTYIVEEVKKLKIQ